MGNVEFDYTKGIGDSFGSVNKFSLNAALGEFSAKASAPVGQTTSITYNNELGL